MKACRYIALILLLCATVASAGQWVVGKSMVPMTNRTLEEAQSEALQAALQEAMESAGIELSGGTTLITSSSSDRLHLFQGFVDCISAQASGRILEKKDIQYSYPTTKDPEGKEQIWCQASVSAYVEPDTKPADPTFSMELATDREVYRDGEPMVITITATKPCWVTIFNLYGDNTVGVVSPNKIWGNPRLEARKAAEFPPAEIRKGMGDLTVTLRPECVSDDEMLMAVAVKDSSYLFDANYTDLNCREIPSYEAALERINRWIMTIPRDQRAQAMTLYNIVKDR
jgi:hypothetical protein